MREKIDSISTVRGIACLGVFFAHIGFSFSDGVGKSCVSIFLILSGFVMTYSYYGMNRITKVSVVDNVIFSYRKTKGLYPLYLLTTCMMTVFLLVGQDKMPILHIAVRLIANLFIVQEWLPISGSSINFVSWYFCVVTYSCFVFPWVLRRIETSYNEKIARISLVVLYCMQVLLGIIGSRIPSNSILNDWLRDDLTVWFVFNFPPVRTIDFLIGCNLGYLFLYEKDNKVMSRSRLFTIAELMMGGVIVLSIIVYTGVNPVDNGHSLTTSSELWWIYTLLFTGGSCSLIYLFALNRGVITKALINRYLIQLAEISPFFFLIHSVVLRYLSALFNLLFYEQGWYERLRPWLLLIIGFPLSIICAKCWSAIKTSHHNLL